MGMDRLSRRLRADDQGALLIRTDVRRKKGVVSLGSYLGFGTIRLGRAEFQDSRDTLLNSGLGSRCLPGKS